MYGGVHNSPIRTVASTQPLVASPISLWFSIRQLEGKFSGEGSFVANTEGLWNAARRIMKKQTVEGSEQVLLISDVYVLSPGVGFQGCGVPRVWGTSRCISVFDVMS